MIERVYSYRYMAQITIETVTPLAVSSGEKGIMTDSFVVRDANGLPYIPGTSLAGILRHAIKGKEKKKIFGFQENLRRIENGKRTEENIGEGSKIIFSSAHIVNEDNTVIEGILNKKEWSGYLSCFKELPIRQHVCINGKGVTRNTGKFDEEVVFKGTRFCFEIEMLSEEKTNEPVFNEILSELMKESLRIGSGTRKGFGETKIVEYTTKQYDLTVDLDDYLEKTSSLNAKIKNGKTEKNIQSNADNDWTTYELTLTPDNFFLFGSGFGNDKADMTAVSETYFDWSNGKPEAKAKSILIPGSSVKGALAHRVVFHYNRLKGFCIKEINGEYKVDERAKNSNEAVETLFGYANNKDVKRGNVMISDLIQEAVGPEKTKILNHVAIDRFTGGAIDGALFAEEVIYGKNTQYKLILKVNYEAIAHEEESTTIKKAFKLALQDIATGMLPLGGGVNRGYGCFSGEIKENGIIMEKML
ncbi:hypothetical protein EZS27_011220 [termite gut metagenome]|uniref:CRISPR type III-associated protein domain-containing protein n=1 Tax=termite gut metagenome TaxID=433724 RepID=A0A5J4S6R0_9ZZZZ